MPQNSTSVRHKFKYLSSFSPLHTGAGKSEAPQTSKDENVSFLQKYVLHEKSAMLTL